MYLTTFLLIKYILFFDSRKLGFCWTRHRFLDICMIACFRCWFWMRFDSVITWVVVSENWFLRSVNVYGVAKCSHRCNKPSQQSAPPSAFHPSHRISRKCWYIGWSIKFGRSWRNSFPQLSLFTSVYSLIVGRLRRQNPIGRTNGSCIICRRGLMRDYPFSIFKSRHVMRETSRIF